MAHLQIPVSILTDTKKRANDTVRNLNRFNSSIESIQSIE